MGTLWKVLVGLVLVVPLAAYVVGPLTPSDAGQHDRSRPVVIGDADPPGGRPSPPAPDQDPPGGSDTDDVRVNNPEPRRLEGRGTDDDAEEESGQRGNETDDDDGTDRDRDDGDDTDEEDDGGDTDEGDDGGDD